MKPTTIGLAVFALAAAVSPARATRTPEEDRKAAYEQMEGKSAGVAATQASGLAAGGYGLKAPPAPSVPLLGNAPAATRTALERVPTAATAPRQDQRTRTPLDKLADRGFSGILFSALLGLGVGGGFGLLTGRKA